jgi:transcriptional regulator with XRE-family HTH domain
VDLCFDASKLQQVREAAGESTEELGDAILRSRASIEGYEAGRLQPSMTVLLRLCAHYGLEPSEWFRPAEVPA